MVGSQYIASLSLLMYKRRMLLYFVAACAINGFLQTCWAENIESDDFRLRVWVDTVDSNHFTTRKHGYLNINGIETIPIEFDGAGDFSEGLADVNYWDGSLEEYSYYIDIDGNPVLDSKFFYTGPFSEGLAAVAGKDRKYGYINKSGEFVIPPAYSEAEPFSEGLAAVTVITETKYMESDRKIGYINKKGEYVIRLRRDWTMANQFKNGIATVLINTFHPASDYSLYFAIDSNGHYVNDSYLMAERVDGAGPYLVRYMHNRLVKSWSAPADRYAYMNKYGKIVIDLPKGFDANSFEEGLAWIKNTKGEAYYINSTGKRIFPLDSFYEEATNFSEKRAFAYTDGKWILISNTGERIGEGHYSYCRYVYSEERCFVVLEGDEKLSLIDHEGNILVKSAYDNNMDFHEYYKFSHGLSRVQVDGKLAVVNMDGMIVWPK